MLLANAVMRLPQLGANSLPLAAGAWAAAVAFAATPAMASTLFQAADLSQERFVLVAAPIGDGVRAQLNIYEQVKPTRPCFAVVPGSPAQVDPLLATFDFSGICSRFIDANGYSVRVGEADLATSYRLTVQRQSGDNVLLAVPTKAGAGPEMLVARTQGSGSGFLQLVFEPGWQLKRRAFGGRNLGHVYLYRDTWPDAAIQPGLPVVAPSPISGLSGSGS
ncbi:MULTISPECIES: DUF3747 domain-containing protein [unclassified Cyanobium]|uniref:DUF3747 domain-containing protein n=1 Tax=unclassified Cyanobium TaxID=2627006 RepID=UPI0028F412C9|nr:MULTISPECIES: DUF3747 domain-containing protein [unclassified Cyanobium]